MSELSVEAQEALTTSRLADLKKKINAGSWSENMELLMKSWGEKAAGLRFMHGAASGVWRGFGNKLTITSILITTVASTASLIASSVDDVQAKNAVLYVTGGIGVVASLVQSLKKFYNAEEKAAEHGAISKQFGSFYRYMTLQMALSPGDRLPSDQLADFALKEFERMQQDAPPLGGGQISLFKKVFKDSNQAVPDVCEDEFMIKIYREPSQETETDSVEKGNSKNSNRETLIEVSQVSVN